MTHSYPVRRAMILAGMATMTVTLTLSAGAQLGNGISHERHVPRTVLMPMAPVGPKCVSQTQEIVPCPSETQTELQKLTDWLNRKG